MSDYLTYKKVYTSGEMFTLTGSDFHGFVETGNLGSANEVSTGKSLTSKNTYETDLFFSIDFKDRVISDINITLPFFLTSFCNHHRNLGVNKIKCTLFFFI